MWNIKIPGKLKLSCFLFPWINPYLPSSFLIAQNKSLENDPYPIGFYTQEITSIRCCLDKFLLESRPQILYNNNASTPLYPTNVRKGDALWI